jgi:Protein of unknown function (DUF3375)
VPRSTSSGRGFGVVNYDEIEQLRANHPAWSLLASANVSLVLSFLSRTFVERNAGAVPASELVGVLDDELYALGQRFGEDRFPRRASEYLDDWASSDRGWLRKFYPTGSDEAHYDLSPSVEKALMWVTGLRGRDFVGTESRLHTIFELLRQMVYGAEDDPERRLEDLRRRRAELDAEIAGAERGEFRRLDHVSQRDRYQQFSQTARELLSDFRQVEENFRRLDRHLREQIAGWTGSKGALLEDALSSRNSIAESDQGRSFQAFYDFLLSYERQAELTDLLGRLDGIEEIAEKEDRLRHVHFDWIDASERTQATVRLLSEQLRRFLDDQVWLENRRVFELLRNIESKALEVRGVHDPEITTEMDDTCATLGLPMERPLYRRPADVELETAGLAAGSEDFDASALVDQMYVDRSHLVRQVWKALGPKEQVGLREVLATAPLEQGLAELVGYLSLADAQLAVVFDDEHREQVGWHAGNVDRVAELPRTSFARRGGEPR